jgi:parallel beta-helix repeat protein
MNDQIGTCCGKWAWLRAWTAAIIGLLIIAPGSINASAVAEDTSAVTQITSCPYSIAKSGSYKLAVDCPNNAAVAITITASNVRLDLGGHTISGPAANQNPCAAPNDGIFVQTPSNSAERIKDVRIKNGRIEGFQFGIRLDNTDDSRLNDLRVRGNCTGIQLLSSDDSRIHDNNVSGNASHGVILQRSTTILRAPKTQMGANNNWIHHNVVNENGVNAVAVTGGTGGGFLITGSNDNAIGANQILRSGNFGIVLTSASPDDPSSPGSNRNALLTNVVSDSAQGRGIQVQRGNNNILSNNTTNNNASEGIDILSAGNLVQNNRSNNNQTRGILIDRGNAENLIQGNTALENKMKDMEDDNLPENCINLWRHNTFKTDNEDNDPNAGCIQ